MKTCFIKLLFLSFFCILLLAFISSCSNFHYIDSTKTETLNIKMGANVLGTLVQQQASDTLIGDSENGYINTKHFLSELSIPEKFISEFSNNELDFFARSDSIASIIYGSNDDRPNMSMIVTMYTTGRIRIYANIEWNSLPKESYTDFISINGFPSLLLYYENVSLSFSYNGISKPLSPETDYQIFINDIGQVGAKIDLKNTLKNIENADEQSFRINFTIDVFNPVPHEYECFNLYLFYQHLHTKLDDTTKVGSFQTRLGFEFNEKSKMSCTYYLMSTHTPLSFFPEGFTNEN